MAHSSKNILAAKAWPFEEAKKIIARFQDKTPAKGYVLFETGYGPSGLPHIGTFGEVVRTSMVRQAFQAMSSLPTKLITFSDDMDGLRKVPTNIPNQSMVAEHLGKPLTSIPDPFGKYESFGHHNNAMLRQFLDHFGFEYDFQSSTECYKRGLFDQALLKLLEHYDEIMAVMLPNLGQERQQTYSPFLPISPKTGKVLQVPILEFHPKKGTLVYQDEDGSKIESPVTGGHCKLQWKPDWAMRWYALEVDYEMSGKDLIPSVKLANDICKILGGKPPEGFNYELFLDQNGEKISKSKGNGLSVEEWLSYAPQESLALFMFTKPKTAKRLYFDVIPKNVDDYFVYLEKYHNQNEEEQLENPIWHIHKGNPPLDTQVPLSFSILLNLVSVCNSDDKTLLWGFISRYIPNANAQTYPALDKLLNHAVLYYRDFVQPFKNYRTPTAEEQIALKDLVSELKKLPVNADSEMIQTQIYTIGKKYTSDLRGWFQSLYEILLGQDQGPRLGSFFALYGLEETIKLIQQILNGQSLMDQTMLEMPTTVAMKGK
ncbi:MAG: lysine--tRNA ligase [Alphaproteobacteria bacterium]|nr:lysine--tRNA ligase [Alphaproteobacteria bacterium]